MTLQLGFVVNDVATERAVYTTTRLAMAAANRGHTVWVMGVGDFAHDPDGKVAAHARGPADRRYRSLDAFLDDVQGDSGRTERICVDELDVLMLRNDPADDLADRAWTMTSGILFGQLAAVRGVLVVNDPGHLADAINKTYFQHFPDWVRPRTLISLNPDEIRALSTIAPARLCSSPCRVLVGRAYSSSEMTRRPTSTRSSRH